MRYLILLFLLIFSCGIEFPTRYDRIEDTLRCLAFVFDNDTLAEGAPGDTVTLRAYFAGDQIRSTKWSVSTQMLLGALTGSDTFADTIPLEQVMVPGTYHEYSTGKTDSIVFDFVVPKDIIKKTFSEVQSIKALLPSAIPDSLFGGALSNYKPIDIINLIDTLATVSQFLTPQIFENLLPILTGSNSADSLIKYFPLLLQTFTVNMKFNLLANSDCRVKGYYSVRYNSRFSSVFPNVPVNRNPLIKSINLYTVKGNRSSFDPDNDSYEKVTELSSTNNTIDIDTSHSYFLEVIHPDSITDIGQEFTTGSYVPEFFHAEWFYKNETQLSEVNFDQLMSIQASQSSNIARLLPSLDKRMVDFSIWVVVYDDLYGEKFRPVGFSFRPVEGKFRYLY